MVTRICINGSRTFQDYELLKKRLDSLLEGISDLKLILGGARGADTLAERYAKENNIPFQVFPADWNGQGKSAGFKRNAQMEEISDALISFWDGESKGTKHTIELFNRNNKPVRVINVKKN